MNEILFLRLTGFICLISVLSTLPESLGGNMNFVGRSWTDGPKP